MVAELRFTGAALADSANDVSSEQGKSGTAVVAALLDSAGCRFAHSSASSGCTDTARRDSVYALARSSASPPLTVEPERGLVVTWTAIPVKTSHRARRLLIATLTAALSSSAVTATAATGELDPTFGHDGRVTTDVSPGFFSAARDVALSSTGQIVAVGNTCGAAVCPGPGNMLADIAIARYRRDGSLDRRFSENGRKVTELTRLRDNIAYAVAVQPDDKIVVVGCAACELHGSNMVVLRYQADGRLDRAFGDNGIRSIDFGRASEAFDVALSPDGAITIAGCVGCSAHHWSGDRPTSKSDMAVARITPEGQLDKTFGSEGLARVSFGQRHDEARALALLPDGSVIAAGCATCDGDFSDVAVARLDAEGVLDETFGDGGKVRTDLGADDDASGIAMDGDDVVVAGGSGRRMAVVRYQGGGALDPTFASDGSARLRLPTDPSRANDVVVASGGAVMLGSTLRGDGAEEDWVLVRLGRHGDIDTAFGTDGVVTTDFPSADPDTRGDVGEALIVQPNGKLLGAGYAHLGPDVPTTFALARYRA